MKVKKAFNLAEILPMSVIFMPDLQQGLNKQSFDETVYLLTAVK